MRFDSSELLGRSDQAERFLRQLSNRYRLMALCLLSGEELSVGQLNERIPLSQSALSQHLTVLRNAGVVATRRQAQTIYYRLTDPKLVGVLVSLCELSESMNDAVKGEQKR